MIRQQLKNFITTLSFMTRLAPPRMVEPDELAATVAWMPLTGAVMGFIICIPFALGLLGTHPDIQAWLAVGASIYITRGLHFDGISDITDGAGPYPNPERFWKIVKDSRCGVFGVMALILSVGGQFLLFKEILAAQAYGTLIWVFMVGRLGNASMCLAGRKFSRPGQGSLFMAGATFKSVGTAFLITFIFGLLLTEIKVQFLAYILCALCILFLYRLAEKVRGANGDFLGAALVLCETAAALSYCLITS
ncbi:adenosylcobinamide-GDP ribazoletransferase [Maridesulfovibrio bastinii]|uniref:adenosylcobinamide-GDP ribazoletransferase n=1 Tax=Maridesulfovibrio bastinii TaxID=47157 RepID=UPI001FE15AFA|nr:adenosylcobinamide-GDP ribazoletransferase [Maridesulfovibrio bastinii]